MSDPESALFLQVLYNPAPPSPRSGNVRSRANSCDRQSGRSRSGSRSCAQLLAFYQVYCGLHSFTISPSVCVAMPRLTLSRVRLTGDVGELWRASAMAALVTGSFVTDSVSSDSVTSQNERLSRCRLAAPSPAGNLGLLEAAVRYANLL